MIESNRMGSFEADASVALGDGEDTHTKDGGLILNPEDARVLVTRQSDEDSSNTINYY